jgi:flagellar biosynthesis component FlhA
MKGPLLWDGGLAVGDPHTVDAYAIDSYLEAALRRRIPEDGWTEHAADEVRRSVSHALGLAGAPADAVLLVPAAVRVAMHDVLAVELPTVRVLARTELPPGTSVTIHEVVGLD